MHMTLAIVGNLENKTTNAELMRLMSEGVGHDTILHLNLTCSLLTKIKPFDHLRRKPRVSCKIWKVINSLNHSFKGN